jgi:hypothetical protein
MALDSKVGQPCLRAAAVVRLQREDAACRCRSGDRVIDGQLSQLQSRGSRRCPPPPEGKRTKGTTDDRERPAAHRRGRAEPQCAPRYCFDGAADDAEAKDRAAALQEGLPKLRWTVGRDLPINYLFPAGSAERAHATGRPQAMWIRS